MCTSKAQFPLPKEPPKCGHCGLPVWDDEFYNELVGEDLCECEDDLTQWDTKKHEQGEKANEHPPGFALDKNLYGGD